MLFNSFEFALFLPVVFCLYWFVTNKNLFLQNALLLVASYYFYACWDWRFLFLLVFSTLLDYYSGLMIFHASQNRTRMKVWLWLSVGINLGFLGVFKYYNFFAETFANATASIGWNVDPWTISVILPVGISFYTFHGLSYVFDIYNGKIEPERNFVNYSLFVSYFPLLVAGPIERATHLLPQVKKSRTFNADMAVDGLRQILWGLFKKIVIADNCANYANEIFNNSEAYSGSTLAIGALFFTFQIYGDFSGYSDIALGTSRLFGIELLRNFAFPYFSRDIAEFWRRWHISLSSWFRDYLYIPLGGSKGGKWMQIRNTFIIFIVSGFWHGANWTFVVWGALNALYFLPLLLSNKNRTNLEIADSLSLKTLWGILTTFSLTVFAWIFFRATSLQHAVSYIRSMFSSDFFSVPSILPVNIILLIMIMVVIEWIGRRNAYAIASLGLSLPRVIRWGFYYLLIVSLFVWGSQKEQTFIYFQF